MSDDRRDLTADAYAETWVASARKCRPIEEWQWDIMARDYLIETTVMRKAFLAYFADRPVEPTAYDWKLYAVADSFFALGLNKRGSTWAGIYNGARRIRAMLAKRIEDAGRPLPYVNTLWLVGGELW